MEDIHRFAKEGRVDAIRALLQKDKTCINAMEVVLVLLWTALHVYDSMRICVINAERLDSAGNRVPDGKLGGSPSTYWCWC